ncbi:RIO1 family regulatory kinase/ATPase domain-containing protein [Halapricum desulfuricans]|uniref:non-specific serine/threonine protein kinase n=1 Tax=Halapricum desulfuricans TaxID=2841257 RepID=A0A897NCC0_9EURY|nr:RIO1 family regulatory kinase/ATPase [Halapricum desulfuricans]QSG10108.1 Serine/threonine protein kinase involved in cellcycle control [Halapricum desulfuricans]
MAFRRLLRGQIDRERLESVARAVAERHGQSVDRIEVLDADNWLSMPFVLDDQYFVKVVSRQHSLVHALLTTGRNLGAFSSGSEGFFEHFSTPAEMADHELVAARKMHDLGINVPRPVEAFEHDGLGVVVMEYLPDFTTLDAAPVEDVRTHAASLFEWLTAMHEAGFAHGDLRAENVLLSRDELYFIDAAAVDERRIHDARAYDIACALAVLEPLIGASDAVAAAATVCDEETLLAAGDFLDFVSIRPDHRFDARAVHGELEKAVAQDSTRSRSE